MDRPQVFPNHLPGLQILKGIDRVCGDQKLYRDLLGLFTQDYANFDDHLCVLLNDNNSSKLAELIHTLKGSAANLAADEVAAAAEDLETKLADVGDNMLQADESLVNSVAVLKDKMEIALGSARSARAKLSGENDKDVTLEVTPHSLANMIVDFELMLEEHDFASQEMLEKIKLQIVDVGVLPALSRLEDEVQHFDFESAQLTLSTLSKHLNIATRPNR